MITRRSFAGASAVGAVAVRQGSATLAEDTPEADTSLPGIVTVTTPVLLERRIIVDHYRLVTPPTIPGTTVILGTITNARPETVAIPYDLEAVIRDQDGVIFGSQIASPIYPVVPPGKSIGFMATLYDVPLDEIDPLRVTFEASEFSTEGTVLDDLAEATIEIESQEEISRSGTLEIEFVVRNTSALDYQSLTPYVAVWDAEWRYCGYVYATVSTTIPAGDAIRFTTSSYGGSLNPLEIAGSDFIWEPWIRPTVST